ncbi:MAG TPA: GNAT family N-acetyltransferase [Planctomycetota bacterium]|nr:GNAT family N-acetyltransferase [Planctomycetota bacterium]
MASRILIRPVREDDAAALRELADLLDTVNLPDDPAALAKIIADSQRSFAGDEHRHAGYTLVAVERDDAGTEKLLGTGSVFAFHGMPDDPHYFLRVVHETVHSKQLGADRKRTLLRLGRDTEPWTELGGLVVHPEARGKGLGKLLLAARLMLVAMHPTRFCTRIIAELLPARREDGSNAFWDAVGGPLTGLNYYRADLLCRTDKEFIEAFFPHDEIVVELLPKEARELIGVEGPATAPVRALLRRAGFRYLETVDPFDAGPHDGANVADIGPIKASRSLVRLDLPPAADTGAVELVVNPATHVFAAMRAQQARLGVRLEDADARALALEAGDPCWAMPLGW